MAAAFEALLVHSGVRGVGRECSERPPVLGGVRLGILSTGAPTPAPDLARNLDAAASTFGELGALVEPVALDFDEDPVAIFGCVQSVEAHDRHRALGLFPDRADRYGVDVRRRLEAASARGLKEYLAGLSSARRLGERLDAIFEHVDLLLSPVSPCPPPFIGQTSKLRDLVLPHTVLQNLTGLPACAFRVGHDDAGLPVGAQVTGPRLGDFAVLGAVRAFADAMAGAWPSFPDC